MEDKVTIKIKYLSKDIDDLKYIDGKSDWIDLRSAETVEMKAGDFRLIPLGIAPRSSTFRNYGIIQTNSVGVVDESYCGDEDEWKLPVYATRDCRIEMNDRVAQFRIMKHQPAIDFEECTRLNKESRGGFGSTGRK